MNGYDHEQNEEANYESKSCLFVSVHIDSIHDLCNMLVKLLSHEEVAIYSYKEAELNTKEYLVYWVCSIIDPLQAEQDDEE